MKKKDFQRYAMWGRNVEELTWEQILTGFRSYVVQMEEKIKREKYFEQKRLTETKEEL